MIDLKDFVDKLRRSGHYVELSMPGKQMHRQKIIEIQNSHGDPEEYFRRIADENKVKSLSATTYTKNGTSWTRKEFFIVTIPAVANNTNETNEATNNTNSSANNTNEITNNTNSTPTSDKTNSMSDVKQEIENIKLSTKLEYAERRLRELEDANKKLSQSNDKLVEDNMQLLRDKNLADDRAELKIKEAKLESDQARINGLGAIDQITDAVTKMPKEAWILLGSFKKDNPFKHYLPEGSNENESEEESLSGSMGKHSDPDAQTFIEAIYSMLITRSPEDVTMITQLIEDFGIKPEVLKKVYAQLHPPKPVTAQA